jgi:SAM-dependent methyltransferase
MEKLKSCPLCSNTLFVDMLSANDYLVSKQIFSIVRCEDCGFVFTNPRPISNDLGRFYLSDEYISHTDSKGSVLEKIYDVVRKYMLKRKLALINKHINTNTERLLLDYGCATGEFLMKAKTSGFQVVGVEPGDHPRAKAIAKGIEVFDSPEILFSGSYLNRISVITLWHVLEHIPDLHQTLRAFGRIIRDDGLIVVAVPEYNSYDAKFYKKHWAAWDVPRHLSHFNEETMVKLFELIGFKKVGIYPLLFDSFYVSLLTEKNLMRKFPGIIRAFIIGCVSNIVALLNLYPYSSQIYMFKKAN